MGSNSNRHSVRFWFLLILLLTFIISPITSAQAEDAQKEGSSDQEPTQAATDFFTLKVAPVIKAKCYRCHNDNDSKGEVSFDNFDWISNFDVDAESYDSFAETELSNLLITTSAETIMPPDGKMEGHNIAVFFDWFSEHNAEVPESIDWDSVSGNIKLNQKELPNDTATLAWMLTGKLHPAVLHFPVALLMVAAILVVFGMGNEYTDKAAVYCLVFGTLGAIASCVSGWSFGIDKGWEWQKEQFGTVTFLHRWGGITTAVLSVFTLLIAFSSRSRENGSQLLWKLGVIVLAVIVGAVGHFGGKKSHGDYTPLFNKLIYSLQGQSPESDDNRSPVDSPESETETDDTSKENSEDTSNESSDDEAGDQKKTEVSETSDQKSEESNADETKKSETKEKENAKSKEGESVEKQAEDKSSNADKTEESKPPVKENEESNNVTQEKKSEEKTAEENKTDTKKEEKKDDKKNS